MSVQEISRGCDCWSADFTIAVFATKLTGVRAYDKTVQTAMQKSILDKAQGEHKRFVYSGKIINKSAMSVKGTQCFFCPLHSHFNWHEWIILKVVVFFQVIFL